jgi:flagellar motor switch protein FliM
MSGGNAMSPEAIAALVSAAREGRLPEESQTPVRRRRMHAVDFSRPTKFSSDQERRIKRAMEAFCRTATSRLSAELRAPLELEIIGTNQLTWANAHSQAPEGALTALVGVQPVGTRMMLAAESGLVLGAIELLVGGTEAAGVRPRRLTDIDWALAGHFFERLLAQMSIIWSDMFELELSADGIDAHMETAQAAPVSEPTLSVMIEARLDGSSSTLTLLLPWQAIASVIERFSGRDERAEVGHGDAQSVRRAIGGVRVPVRAEVASVHLPIEAVLALKPGDVLPLQAPADGGVTLYADKVPVHRAKPGRSGARRAVQIAGPARPSGGGSL